METVLIGLVVLAVCTVVYKWERHDFVKHVEDIDWDENWF